VSGIESIYIYVLIYVVSLTFQLPVSFNIFNLCQNIDLISPVYFIYGGRWHSVSSRETGGAIIMRNILEFNSEEDMLEGALVYRAQRRQHTKSNKLIQDELKRIQLLVAWRIERRGGVHVRALLVEYDKELDKDKLRKLHQKYWHLLKAQIHPIGNNWVLNNTSVLMTTVNVMNGGYTWDIFISEEERYAIQRPLWVNAAR
jgi:hypothetical protein